MKSSSQLLRDWKSDDSVIARLSACASCSGFLVEPEITKIDRNQKHVANWFQIWSTQVGKALGRKAETIHLHNVVDILRRRKSACYIDVVVVPAQEEIVAEVEVLFFTMGSRLETVPAPAPRLVTLLATVKFQ